jgi:HK97 family phage prohead protease
MRITAGKIVGWPVLWNSLSDDLGGFKEIIRRQPLAEMTKNIDLVCLVGHDPQKPLGRISARTLAAATDEIGLHIECAPPESTYGRDAVMAIARGDASGASFRFSTIHDAWSQHREGFLLREVTDMRVSEVSVACVWPAYSATASRAVGDHHHQGRGAEAREDLQRVAARARDLLRREPPGTAILFDWRTNPKTERVQRGASSRGSSVLSSVDRTRTVPTPVLTEMKARVCRRLTRPRPGTVAALEADLIAMLAR